MTKLGLAGAICTMAVPMFLAACSNPSGAVAGGAALVSGPCSGPEVIQAFKSRLADAVKEQGSSDIGYYGPGGTAFHPRYVDSTNALQVDVRSVSLADSVPLEAAADTSLHACTTNLTAEIDVRLPQGFSLVSDTQNIQDWTCDAPNCHKYDLSDGPEVQAAIADCSKVGGGRCLLNLLSYKRTEAKPGRMTLHFEGVEYDVGTSDQGRKVVQTRTRLSVKGTDIKSALSGNSSQPAVQCAVMDDSQTSIRPVTCPVGAETAFQNPE